MAKTKISITLSELDKAIQEIEQFNGAFQRKAQLLLQRVAERLAVEVRQGFSGAIVDDLTAQSGGAKTASVSVKVEQQGDTWVVIANGEDAIWVEFGAGVYHNGAVGSQPNPYAKNVTGVQHPPIAIGTFGKNGRKKSWGYYEDGELKITHGTPAQMPMYKAVQSVSNEIVSIAREVFG